MLRFAVIVVIVGTIVGAIMPSDYSSAPAVEQNDRGTAGDSASSSTSSGDSVALEREDNGHFYANVQVNGMPVRFLVDTGASGIALSRDDARRAGLAPSAMTEVIGEGAAGEVRGEYVTLDRVSLGETEVRQVSAVVLDRGDTSLLGQSFLTKFDVEISGDRMVLR